MIENRTQVVITTYQRCPLCTVIKVKDGRDVFAVLRKAITDIADPSLSSAQGEDARHTGRRRCI